MHGESKDLGIRTEEAIMLLEHGLVQNGSIAMVRAFYRPGRDESHAAVRLGREVEETVDEWQPRLPLYRDIGNQ